MNGQIVQALDFENTVSAIPGTAQVSPRNDVENLNGMPGGQERIFNTSSLPIVPTNSRSEIYPRREIWHIVERSIEPLQFAYLPLHLVCAPTPSQLSTPHAGKPKFSLVVEQVAGLGSP
jgi:hypothetical protein